MRFTTKCKYGLRAVLEIASHSMEGDTIVKRRTIAKKQNIPDSYLENILILLKNGGIVRSTRGKNGGYYLTRPMDKISLYDIITILEGKSLLEDCIEGKGDCVHKDYCKIKYIWEEINDMQQKLLKSVSISEIIRNGNDCIPCFKEDIQNKIAR